MQIVYKLIDKTENVGIRLLEIGSSKLQSQARLKYDDMLSMSSDISSLLIWSRDLTFRSRYFYKRLSILNECESQGKLIICGIVHLCSKLSYTKEELREFCILALLKLWRGTVLPSAY